MSINDLEFKDWQDKIAGQLGRNGEWISVFALDNVFSDVERGCFFCVLMDNSLIADALKKHSWEIHGIGAAQPGLIEYWEGGKKIRTRYVKNSDDGIENIVQWRTFPGIEERYFEIAEDFRLFYNLYQKDKQFFHFDDNGDKHLVAEIGTDEVKIKVQYLKKYISVRGMSLMVYFEFMRFSDNSIQELGYEPCNTTTQGEDFIYSLCIYDWNEGKKRSLGRILGKKVIRGIQSFVPSLNNDEEKRYEEFIIGIDEDGNNIMHTCNEDFLANYFGKNPDAPNYLTPVYFTRNVLTKYYSNPQEYEVSDGSISRKSFWSLQIDNNLPDYVCVFLGDLGNLHHAEQLYWKSFNTYSSDAGISSTNWQRSFQGEFSDPDQVDLYFKQAFNRFQEEWSKTFGWHLFLPLHPQDEHHFGTLRIPLRQEQKEFDEQILSLTKIIIDSLNEKELGKSITSLEPNAKGITKLDGFLKSRNCSSPNMIQFLRDLQDLRSSSSAHRKGSNYEKAKKKFGLTHENYIATFQEILVKTIRIFNTLEKHMIATNSIEQDV
jgi:hypothetical protein